MKAKRAKKTAYDYRDFLKKELRARQFGNPSYSRRAYARDLGIGASRLTEILSGKQGLSPATAVKIASRLGLSGEPAEQFVDGVRARHARSAEERRQAQEKLDGLAADTKYRQMELSSFRVIAHWLPFAILELIKTKGFVSKPAYVARRFGVTEAQVREALAHLANLEFISIRDDVWSLNAENTFVGKNVPSHAIKQFHTRIAQKALTALHQAPLEQREFGSLVFAVDSRRLPDIKSRLREFVRSIDKEFGTPDKSAADHVGCLGTQFILLSRPESAPK